MTGRWERWRSVWSRDPKGISIDLLRFGVGIIWLANLLFILVPSNQYFGSFQSVASSFGPTTLGGPGVATFVSAYPAYFAWMIALLTAYLAVAFLSGFTTRLACLVGGAASTAFFLTQFGSTIVFNGSGTDVGAHPLYLLIYLVLYVGGAGRYFAVDRWVWASGRARLPAFSRWIASPWEGPVPAPSHARSAKSPVPATTASRSGAPPVSPLSSFRLTGSALAVYAVAGLLISFGVAAGMLAALPVSASPRASEPVHFVNLTININNTTGTPQYSPANFSVPAGPVVFTLVDNDQPMSWSACPCPVRGTIGQYEMVNGTRETEISGENVAHTFTIPALGLYIWSPGQSTVQFEVDLANPGNFTWECLAPCGAGQDPYDTPPMGVFGWMMGTLTVTS